MNTLSACPFGYSDCPCYTIQTMMSLSEIQAALQNLKHPYYTSPTGRSIPTAGLFPSSPVLAAALTSSTAPVTELAKAVETTAAQQFLKPPNQEIPNKECIAVKCQPLPTLPGPILPHEFISKDHCGYCYGVGLMKEAASQTMPNVSLPPNFDHVMRDPTPAEIQERKDEFLPYIVAFKCLPRCDHEAVSLAIDTFFGSGEAARGFVIDENYMMGLDSDVTDDIIRLIKKMLVRRHQKKEEFMARARSDGHVCSHHKPAPNSSN